MNLLKKKINIIEKGFISLINDRNHYINNLLPKLKEKQINENIIQRTTSMFPIHDQNSFNNLTYKERDSINKYRKDRLKLLQLIFLFPLMTVPIYYNYANIYPSRFYTNKDDDYKDRSDYVFRLSKQFDFQKILNDDQTIKNWKSISDIDVNKIKKLQKIISLDQKLDLFLNEFNYRCQASKEILDSLNSYMGLNTWYNGIQYKKYKVQNLGYYIIQENNAILKEINNIETHEFEEILEKRSLKFKGLTQEEMKDKFIKYTDSLNKLYLIEQGNSNFDNIQFIDDNKPMELYKLFKKMNLPIRDGSKFYVSFILYNCIIINNEI